MNTRLAFLVVVRLSGACWLVACAGCGPAPDLDSSSAVARRRAVEQTYDEPRLAGIVLTDPSDTVRRAALKRIADPDQLVRVIQGSAHHELRWTAYERWRERAGPAQLVHLLSVRQDVRVEADALERLTDAEAIADLVCRREPSPASRYTLSEKVSGLSSSGAVVRIAAECPDAGFALTAADKVNDQSSLRRLATAAVSPAVRGLARCRIDEENLAALITEGVLPASIREARRLAEVAQSDTRSGAEEERHARSAAAVAAAEAVQDDPILAYLAARASDRFARMQATARMPYDERWLATMAEGPTSDVERALGVLRIAAHDPRLVRRVPGLTLRMQHARITQGYSMLPGSPTPNAYIVGETVRFQLVVDDRVLAEVAGVTEFPGSASLATGFIAAKLAPAGVLRDLYVAAQLTPLELAQIAGDAPAPALRLAALAGIDDPALLPGLLPMNRDERVRSAVVARLDDQATLAELISSEQEPAALRAKAALRLTDPAAAAAIVRNGALPLSVRGNAMRAVTDADLLARMVERGELAIQLAAMEQVTDPALIARVARRTEFPPDLRAAAAAKLRDPALQRKLALEDSHAMVRRAAIRNIDDQVLLARLAVDDGDVGVRLVAFAKVTDQTEIGHIACRTIDHGQAEKALRSITDSDVLAQVAERARLGKIRDQAAQRLAAGRAR